MALSDRMIGMLTVAGVLWLSGGLTAPAAGQGGPPPGVVANEAAQILEKLQQARAAFDAEVRQAGGQVEALATANQNLRKAALEQAQYIRGLDKELSDAIQAGADLTRAVIVSQRGEGPPPTAEALAAFSERWASQLGKTMDQYESYVPQIRQLTPANTSPLGVLAAGGRQAPAPVPAPAAPAEPAPDQPGQSATAQDPAPASVAAAGAPALPARAQPVPRQVRSTVESTPAKPAGPTIQYHNRTRDSIERPARQAELGSVQQYLISRMAPPWEGHYGIPLRQAQTIFIRVEGNVAPLKAELHQVGAGGAALLASMIAPADHSTLLTVELPRGAYTLRLHTPAEDPGVTGARLAISTTNTPPPANTDIVEGVLSVNPRARPGRTQSPDQDGAQAAGDGASGAADVPTAQDREASARNIFDTAEDLYRKRSYRAAVAQYQMIIKDYEDTEVAARARQRINYIRSLGY